MQPTIFCTENFFLLNKAPMQAITDNKNITRQKRARM